MGSISTTEYRQARAAIRDASAVVLDELDYIVVCLAHGDAPAARDHARKLAMIADDLTAMCEKVVRLTQFAG